MEDVSYVDTESFSSGSNDIISFQQIVLKHLFTISKLASVEMTGGYWQKKAIPINNTIMTTEVYIPDAREVYSNAVKHLFDLLLPYFDKDMKTEAQAHETTLSEMFEATTSLYDGVDEKLNVRVFKTDELETIYRKQHFNLSRKLFQKLSLFMKRNGYLKTKDLEVGD